MFPKLVNLRTRMSSRQRSMFKAPVLSSSSTTPSLGRLSTFWSTPTSSTSPSRTRWTLSRTWWTPSTPSASLTSPTAWWRSWRSWAPSTGSPWGWSKTQGHYLISSSRRSPLYFTGLSGYRACTKERTLTTVWCPGWLNTKPLLSQLVTRTWKGGYERYQDFWCLASYDFDLPISRCQEFPSCSSLTTAMWSNGCQMLMVLPKAVNKWAAHCTWNFEIYSCRSNSLSPFPFVFL